MRLNTFAPRGPMDAPIASDPNELRLRGLEELLRSLRLEWDDEQERRRVEDERRARFDERRVVGQIAMREMEVAELRASIEARKTHVRTQAEADLDRLRRQRLDDEEARLRARIDAIGQQRANLGDEP